ncbi:MAG: hypothetical protein AAGF24_12520 [Cyanobacteria bacterium P01_H01_bin.121]
MQKEISKYEHLYFYNISGITALALHGQQQQLSRNIIEEATELTRDLR